MAYEKEQLKIEYQSQADEFEPAAILTAEHMDNIDAGLLQAASAAEVAESLNTLDSKIDSEKQSIMQNVGTKASINQGSENANKFWKVGEDGGLTFEAGVPVDSTLTQSGQAADAAAVGAAITESADKKGDTIQINGQKISLMATTEKGKTEISSATFPAGVSGLVLDQDKQLYVKDVNGNQLGEAVDMAQYPSTGDVEGMLTDVSMQIMNYTAEYNTDGKRIFKLKATDPQGKETITSEFPIDIIDDGKQKMVIKEAEYSKSPMATFLEKDEEGRYILKDSIILGYSFTGLTFNGETIFLPEVQAEWYYGNELISSRTVSSGGDGYSQDVSRFITEPRDYTFTLKLIHTKTVGEETVISTAEHSWLIEVAQISITSTYNSTQVNSPNSQAQINIASSGKLPVASRDEDGNPGATMYYKIDGEIVRKTRIRSLGNTSYTVPGISHGTKLFEAYIIMYFGEDENGDPKYLESNHLQLDLMWADPKSNIPIIHCIDQHLQLTEYQTKNIVYTIYNSNLTTMYASLLVEYKDLDGNTVSESRKYEYEFSGRNLNYTHEALLHSEDDPNEVESEHHLISLTLYSDKEKTKAIATKQNLILVIEAPYDLSPISGNTFYFDPAQKTNEELDFNVSTVTVWDNNGYVITAGRDSFDWSSGGYIKDINDTPCFCIKAGSEANISYKLFGDKNTKAQGKEFKIIFKTDKVSQNNPVFLSCITAKNSGKKIGLEMKTQEAFVWQQPDYTYKVTGSWSFHGDPVVDRTANMSDISFTSADSVYNSIRFVVDTEEPGIYYDEELVYSVNQLRWLNEEHQNINFGEKNYTLSPENYAILIANAESMDSKTPYLRLPYSENDIIEADFNIEYALPLISGYEDGIASCWFEYSNLEDLHQDSPVDITIGSPYCDVYIYKMRVYEKSLTQDEILTNFKADGFTYQEKTNRYKRNSEPLLRKDTYSLDELGTLASKLGDLRIVCISSPVFTTDKTDKVKDTRIDYFYHKGYETGDTPRWTAKNCQHSGQGTSSNEYGFSGRNLDLIMNKSGYEKTKPEIKPIITLEDGSAVAGVALTKDSVPVNYFNIKVNIASSENANNALLAKRYNRYQPFKRCLVDKDGNREVNKIKDTMEFFNCLIFVQESDENLNTHKEFNNTSYNFYGLGNIGDSKKTDYTRVNNPEDPKECIIELLDIGLPNSDFGSGGEDQKDWDTNSYKYGDQISDEEWFTILGYYEVDSKYYIDESLPALYDKIDESYVKTSDTKIISGKTYYAPRYKNPKYAGLQPSKFYLDKGEPAAEDGWYKSYDFRYIHDDANEQELVDKWNAMYECIVRAPDDAADERDTFKKRFEDLFDVTSVAYYYLFTLRYTMVDNRAKNTFWHYGKQYYTNEEAQRFANYEELKQGGFVDDEKARINEGYRWDLAFDYDNDTSLGIDNRGRLKYRYGYEDKDCDDETGKEVFRESDSLFFERFANTFKAEIARVFDSVASAMWSSEDLIAEFDNWQAQFPEEIWIRDIQRKYRRTYEANNKAFLVPMANGKKKYQRRQYERKQDKYIASKFLSSGFISDNIQMRCVAFNQSDERVRHLELTITSKDYGYIGIEFGNGGTKQQKFKPGETRTFLYDDNVEENNYSKDGMDIYIRGASFISNLGDLSELYLQNIKLGNATNLTSLSIGRPLDTPEYANGDLSEIEWGDNDLITYLNIEGLTNLTKAPSAENLPRLVSLYARDSGVTGFELKNMHYLKEAYLTTTNILSISSTPRLQILGLDLASPIEDGTVKYLTDNSLTTLIIKDIPSDMRIVRSADLLTQDGASYEIMLNKISTGNILSCSFEELLSNSCKYETTRLERARLENIDWNLEDAILDTLDWVPSRLLEYLYGINGISDDGNYIVQDDSILTGKVVVQKLSTRFKSTYIEKWPELIVNSDNFATEYSVTFRNTHDPSLKEADYVLEIQWVSEYGLAEDPSTRPDETTRIIPIKPPSPTKVYQFDSWSSNLPMTVPVTQDYTLDSMFSEEDRYYTVIWQDENQNELGRTSVTYRQGAEYEGPIPTKDSEDNTTYFLFSGWDGYPYSVTEDLVLTAQFESAAAQTNTPLAQSSPALLNAISRYGHYLHNKPKDPILEYESTFLEYGQYIDIEIGWDPDDDPYSPHTPIFDLFKSSYFVYKKGADKPSKVEESEVSRPRPVVLNHTGENGEYAFIDTGIKLFDGSRDEFAIILDYRANDKYLYTGDFNGPNENNLRTSQRILDCHRTDADLTNYQGFYLYRNENQIVLKAGNESSGSLAAPFYEVDDAGSATRMLINPKDSGERSNPSIIKQREVWSEENQKYVPQVNSDWNASDADRIIIQKRAGEPKLEIYSARSAYTKLDWKDKSWPTSNMFEDLAFKVVLNLSENYTAHNNTLILGCGRDGYNTFSTSMLSNLTVDNLKIYDKAFSDVELKKAILYPKDTLTFWLTQFPRLNKDNQNTNWYAMNESGTEFPGIMLDLRDYLKCKREYEGYSIKNYWGWDDNQTRYWLNNRIYPALPQTWQSAIKSTRVYYLAGNDNTSYDLYSCYDYLFVPCCQEYANVPFGNTSASVTNPEIYNTEGPQATTTYVNSAQRIKYHNVGGKWYNTFSRTRSPLLNKTGYVRVNPTGNFDAGTTANYRACATFAFCV